MKTLRRIAFLVSSLTALAGLTSCAVMRIDVDVYKGPLADGTSVQIQGFSVMATGAKPLLIQLRDTLQWPDEYNRQCARLSPWYRPEFFQMRQEPLFDDPKTRGRQNLGIGVSVADLPVSCRPGVSANIWNERAERVNAVLSLYEDRVPSPYSLIAENLRQEVNKYTNAVAYLEGRGATGEPRNEELWAEISDGFYWTEPRDDPIGLRREPLEGVLPLAEAKLLIRQLTLAYKEFFGLPLTSAETAELSDDVKKEDYASDKVRVAYNAIIDAAKKANAPRDAIRTITAGALHTEETDTANQIFKRLLDKTVRDTHILVLFRNLESKEALAFSREVALIARSFLSAREALHEIWVLSLDAILILNGTEDFLRKGIVGPKALELTPVQRQRLETLNEEERRDLIASYAEIATYLTQERYLLAALLSRNNAPDVVRQQINNLNMANSVRTLPAGVSHLEQHLPEWLRDDPVETIRWLRAADRWIQNVADGDFDPASLLCGASKSDCFYMRTKAHREYGVVEGPIAENRESIEKALDTAAQALALSAVGLGEGRIDEGLETLLENYLEAHSPRNLFDKNEVGEEQELHDLERLLDAMVRFAKKILIIADNHKLLSDDSTSNATSNRTGGNNDLERNGDIYGGEPISRRANLYSGNRKELDRYILVLQAVGNSIRIQADELRQQEKYRDRLKDRRDAEITGLAEAFSLTNEEIFEIYTDKLRDQRSDATATEKQAKAGSTATTELDKLITTAIGNGLVDTTVALKPGDEKFAEKSTVHQLVQIRDANRVMTGQDAKEMQNAITSAAKGGNISGEEARQAIITRLSALSGAYPPVLSGDSRAITLKNAKLFFENQASGVVGNIAAATDQKVFTEIKDRLSTQNRAALTALNKLKTVVQGEKSKRAVDLASATKKVAELTKAIADLQKLKRRILLASDAEELRARPNAIKQNALAAIDDSVGGASCAQSPKHADCSTYDLVSGLDAPDISAQSIVSRKRGKNEGAKDVLDDLIAMLRYDLIRAIREDGKGSVQAKQAGEALKAAYDQRAGLAYIRPAGAYLRSSYPSTSLQDDPGLSWSNMLVDHGLRATPFVGPAYRYLESDQDAVEITAEIDKQFWQNINSVRVAGAGATNYVIAKDPVGNWYVKSYSSNPESIIRSARNLALFGMSTGGTGNLLARLQQREAQANGAGDGDGGSAGSLPNPGRSAAPGPLEQLLTNHRQRYAESTTEDFNALVQLTAEPAQSTLTQELTTSLTNNADTGTDTRLPLLLDGLDTAAREALGEANAPLAALGESAPAAERAEAILASLNEMLRFLPTFQQQVNGTTIISSANGRLTEATAERVTQEAALAALKTELASIPEEDRQPRLDTAASAVQAAKDEEDAAQQNLESARRAVGFAISEARRLLHKHVTRIADRRRDAIGKYEEAIAFIGDANNPEPPPQEPPAAPTTPAALN